MFPHLVKESQFSVVSVFTSFSQSILGTALGLLWTVNIIAIIEYGGTCVYIYIYIHIYMYVCTEQYIEMGGIYYVCTEQYIEMGGLIVVKRCKSTFGRIGC